MGKHIKDIIFSLLNGVDEENLQQGEVQIEEHIQDVASHQHLDDVRVDKDQRDLGVVQELLKERWEKKAESRVELLLTKEDDTMSYHLSGCRFSIH